jgi:hypothetical protein
LHTDNPEIRRHGGIVRACQNERGLCVTCFRKVRENEARAGNVTRSDQVLTAFQQGCDFIARKRNCRLGFWGCGWRWFCNRG